MAIPGVAGLPRARRRYLLGLTLLLCVVVLWVASSTLIQTIFTNMEFNRPFFLTYFSTSLFTLYLLSYGVKRQWREWRRERNLATQPARRLSLLSIAADEMVTDGVVVDSNITRPGKARRGRRGGRPTTLAPLKMRVVAASGDGAEAEDEDDDELLEPHAQEQANLLGAQGHTTSSSNSSSSSSSGIGGSSSINTSNNDEDEEGKESLGLRDTLRISLMLCPVWFMMNYLFNLSLELTSVASGTVLSSTSGAFVMAITSCLSRTRPRLAHVAGVVCTVAGVALISAVDVNGGDGDGPGGGQGGGDSGGSSSSSQERSLEGDVCGLAAAVLYAVYTLILEKQAPESRRVDMELCFGLIGLCSTVLLWPAVFALDWWGVEAAGWPPTNVLLFLLLNGLFGTVVADFMWAQSVLLTSPLIATIGLTLTIPLAIVSDLLVKHTQFHALYLAGATLVFGGFCLVNLGGGQERGEEHDGEVRRAEAEIMSAPGDV